MSWQRAYAPSLWGCSDAALYLLRTAPPAALAWYYVGTLPFVLALMTYWSTLQYVAGGAAALAPGALGLGLLFIWMKFAHARYVQHLLAHLRRGSPRPLSLGQALRSASHQGLIHATAFLVWPVALPTLLGAPVVYAFYQGALAHDDGAVPDTRTLVKRAAREARMWPRLTLALFWLLSPMVLTAAAVTLLLAGGVLLTVGEALNDGTALLLLFLLGALVLVAAPFSFLLLVNLLVALQLAVSLGATLTGTTPELLRAPGAFDTGTALVVMVALTYCLLDPAAKAAFALRSFYASSTESGRDLQAALQRRAASRSGPMALAGVLLAVALLGAAPAWGQATERAVAADAFSQEMERTLTTPVFTWREARPAWTPDLEGADLSWIESWANWINEWTEWIVEGIWSAIRWFFGLFIPRNPGVGGPGGWNWVPPSLPRLDGLLIGITIIGTAILVLVLGRRLYLEYRARQAEAPDEEAEPAAVTDLEDESVSAADLPEAGWLRMAEELYRKGEYRLSMRALYLAELAWLDEQQLIAVNRAKTNRDYLNELRRRSHVHPELVGMFQRATGAYESVWYGTHPATRTQTESFLAHSKQLRGMLNG